MNILIKLTCLVGLVIAPILGHHDLSAIQTNQVRKEISVEINAEDANQAQAIITIITEENGEEVIEKEVIEGTLEEVKAKASSYKK